MPSMRLSEVAELVGGECVGERDPVIRGAAGIDDAGPGDLTFATGRRFVAKLAECAAEAVIVGPEVETSLPAIRVQHPYPAFARFLACFEAEEDRVFPPGIHPTAVIDGTAELADDVAVGPYCVIGAGARIGAGTRLGPHVVLGPDVTLGAGCRLYARCALREGCRVGDRVILHIGVTLGTDGFGYLPSPQGLTKIPQVGIVVLEDDVEIGAGACVDRATTGRTVIGRGTKIDNLVQVGHNVALGSDCALSAQTGLAGSAKVGDRVTMGGQVGLSHSVTVGSDARIGGQAGVTRDLPGQADYFGTPAIEARAAFRISSAARRLPELLRRVAQLEKMKEDTGAGK